MREQTLASLHELVGPQLVVGNKLFLPAITYLKVLRCCPFIASHYSVAACTCLRRIHQFGREHQLLLKSGGGGLSTLGGRCDCLIGMREGVLEGPDRRLDKSFDGPGI